MAKATNRAMVMATRMASRNAGDGKGGKSNGDDAKRAIARKRVMAGQTYKNKLKSFVGALNQHIAERSPQGVGY
jgi:hypothetical protein